MNAPAGELALESNVPEGPGVFRFDTADGVPSKDSFRDGELLLLESLWESDLGRLLVPEANYGVVGVVLVPRCESVHLAESSARARRLCERNARANGVDVSTSLVADPTTLDATFDAVAYAPKPYAPLSVGKQRIADALSVLEPGGRLFLAAGGNAGLSRYERCLQGIATRVRRRDSRGDHVLLEAKRPESFDPPAFVSPREFEATVEGTSLSLVSVPGLFSPSKLDAGTRRLLETATVEDGDRVLDLCCGYGPVGAYAASIADCEVWCTDDDRLATRCAERSLHRTGVEGAVVTADCLDGVVDRRFDRVLCNPPTHAGSGVLAELSSGARSVLEPNGTFLTVTHRAVDFERHLTAFEDVRTVEETDEYVLREAIA